MPIIFEKQKKTQRNLILVFAGVLLITIIILWQSFLREGGGEIIPISPILPKKEIKINFEILASPRLEKLQSFSAISPFKEVPATGGKPGEKIGRENPFLPH